MNSSPLLVLLASLVALASAACSKAECADDVDCDALAACVDGACQPLDLLPASLGVCSDDNDCSAREVCVEGACTEPEGPVDATCRYELDPACVDEGTICVTPLDERCKPGELCVLPYRCRPPVESGLEWGMPCDADAACRSGRCVAGLCARACSGESGSIGGCPPGFDCRESALPGGELVKTCLAVDADGTLQDGVTRCFRDDMCPEGRICGFGDLDDELLQRRQTPKCIVPYAEGRPDHASCDFRQHHQCARGLCFVTCADNESVALCGEYQCQAPCENAADCSPPWECATQQYLVDGRPFLWCQMPRGGCYRDTDCCPTKDAQGCFAGWGDVQTYCAALPLPGFMRFTCVEPGGKALPGAACADDAACASNLCLEVAGARRCSSPCDVRRDDCGERVVAGSTCQPYTWEVDGRRVEYAACQ